MRKIKVLKIGKDVKLNLGEGLTKEDIEDINDYINTPKLLTEEDLK